MSLSNFVDILVEFPALTFVPLTRDRERFASISMVPVVSAASAVAGGPGGKIVVLSGHNGFRWAFYGVADVSVAFSLGMTIGFLIVCVGVIAWIFKTGYRLRN